MTAAARQRQYRERCRSGRTVLRIECDPVVLERVLIDAKVLADETDDRAVLERGLARLVELLARDA
jgi:hypothetical protein